MSPRTVLIQAIASLQLLAACNQPKPQEPTIAMQSDFPAPPVAKILSESFNEFGVQRIDDYFWLKEKTNPEVIAYLEAENAYCDTVMKSTAALQEELFNEMKARIKETDETAPKLNNGYNYYSRTEEGKQYRIYCRKALADESSEEILFNVNTMAEGKPAFIFAGYDVSLNNNLAAYLSNETGSFADFTLRIRDLETGQDLPLNIDKVQSMAWANDNTTIFYTLGDETLRADKVFRMDINFPGEAELVFEEPDEQFILYVQKTKTNDFILINSGSTTTSEYLYLPANEPKGKFKVFLPRTKDVEYHVDHHKEKFFILYKDREHLNRMVYEAPLKGFSDKSTWKVIVPYNDSIKIENMEVFQDFLAISVRKNGLTEINVLGLRDNSHKNISFPEPVYTSYLDETPEYAASVLRYVYTSLNRPSSTYAYNMETGISTLLKQQEVPGGFNPDDYAAERVWAKTADGVQVPMSVIYKKGLKRDGNNPALLYSYGSYGVSSDAYFISSFFSLIDRGFVFAIAQIRGGSDMGEQWYEDGKLLKKKNTFNDFIACAEQLIADKYTSSQKLSIMGGSAGGLLVGAVLNMRPDLFNAAVAQVPFVDVITTMMDASLPLTTQEYEEWGNPNEKPFYDYMLSYSPYDNIKSQVYPHILVTAGLNDSQVLYHEPAKYVAKLRATKKGDNILLLRTNMESGHGGATGRYSALKETAFEMTFLLKQTGTVNVEP